MDMQIKVLNVKKGTSILWLYLSAESGDHAPRQEALLLHPSQLQLKVLQDQVQETATTSHNRAPRRQTPLEPVGRLLLLDVHQGWC